MPVRKGAAVAAETDALPAYLRAIAQIPRLTPDEEKDLGRRIQENHDEAALCRLVEGNLRFAVSYAKRYRNLRVPFLDLIHEGNLGLIEAAKRFDPARNVKFITYAVWWIRQAILHALSDQTRVFSLPQKLSGVAAHFGRDLAALTEQLHRSPTTAEIAEDLDISTSDVDALVQISGADVSLNERLGARAGIDEGPELGETLEQGSIPPVDEALIRRTLTEQVRAALGELEQKEREVMELRFGLHADGEAKTLQEIGDRLKLSRERIRQIESRAKDKLRRSKKVRDLRSYLN